MMISSHASCCVQADQVVSRDGLIKHVDWVALCRRLAQEQTSKGDDITTLAPALASGLGTGLGGAAIPRKAMLRALTSTGEPLTLSEAKEVLADICGTSDVVLPAHLRLLANRLVRDKA
jgi:hypothetical protein